ncbi:sugar ABC transporter substrate-binding protein [Streptacidiphilus jiangxiensis]|uniref:D-xylose transport system substrate-binding protein n=1 Tax=Streptacidiphilus jiangxiensis TaxID=235985 RepID=A0A1H7YL65_STRJI|nr:substrate-binding domain-containing protein [Streptacidiphilus jiangxiensis]SEM46574.1 D-xylose transport system substrate-binding protein [Streptacidiphilus jiangxiensis]
MKRTPAALSALTVVLGLGLAACGSAGGAGGGSASAVAGAGAGPQIIGLLLPEDTATRYEQFDRPLFEAKVKALAPNVTVRYANAGGSAQIQAQQLRTMVNAGASVLVVDAQDSAQIKSSIEEAKARGVKVVAYDRLAQGPVDAYVSFDNEKVGELQGQGLLDAMGDKATPDAKVVEIDGDAADPNSVSFERGFLAAVQGKVNIAYDASGLWKPDVAAQKMTAAINQLGARNIAGVYSANDGMAAGIVNALRTAGLTGTPIGGQDAQLDAVQRIVAGTQSYTVYKAYKPEAEAAAELAVDLLQGHDIGSLAAAMTISASGDAVHADLLTPVLLTKANIRQTVVADGLYTVGQICTLPYASACRAAGLQ